MNTLLMLVEERSLHQKSRSRSESKAVMNVLHISVSLWDVVLGRVMSLCLQKVPELCCVSVTKSSESENMPSSRRCQRISQRPSAPTHNHTSVQSNPR